MGATPVEMYKLFFGSQEMCPDTQVSSPVPGHTIRTFIINLPFKELPLEQEWIAKAKLIRCPAPLPETMPDPVLTGMLEVAPSEEGEGGNKEATASMKEPVRKGGIENPSIQGKKRTASEDPETMVSKRGKKSLSEGPAPRDASAAL